MQTTDEDMPYPAEESPDRVASLATARAKQVTQLYKQVYVNISYNAFVVSKYIYESL